MQIANEDLDEWAQELHNVNSYLLRAMTAAMRGDAKTAGEYASTVQGKLNRLGHRLVRAGAADPMAKAQAELREQAREAGMPVKEREITLEMFTSPANRRLAETLRAAWEAAIEVDKERGD